MNLSVAPAGLRAFSAANTAAAEVISAAGSADDAANLSAAAAALGPIGASFLAAYGPAQTNNITSTRLVAQLHSAIAAATEKSNASFVSADGG